MREKFCEDGSNILMVQLLVPVRRFLCVDLVENINVMTGEAAAAVTW